MTRLRLTKQLLCLLGIVAVLAGCGVVSGQSTGFAPSGASPLIRQTHHGSWMDKASSSGPLLYVSLPYDRTVNIYTVPGAQLVGQITGLRFPWALCSDNSGNVWVADEPTYYKAVLKEYARGGTSPIRTLRDANGAVLACAYDSTTGNLAAVSAYDYSRGGYVDVYARARGKPTIYRPYSVWYPNSAAFDSQGDLFIAGRTGNYAAGTDWLRKGASTITELKLKKPHTYPHVGVVVTGNELTAIAHPSLINQYEIVEGKAKYSGSFTLNVPEILYCSLSNSTLVASGGDSVYLFNYPTGGNPTLTIAGLAEPTGVTMSVAPSHSRIQKHEGP